MLRNFGAATASGDVLAFVDADHEIADTWVAAVRRVLAEPDVAATGAMCSPPHEGTWVQRAYGLLRGLPKGTHDVEWLGSGNLAVRRSAFESVGGFDTSLTTCEDVDLCRRIRTAGHRIVSSSELRNVHYGDPATLWDLFKGELWRGQDNLRVTLRGPLTWRGLPSVDHPHRRSGGNRRHHRRLVGGRRRVARWLVDGGGADSWPLPSGLWGVRDGRSSYPIHRDSGTRRRSSWLRWYTTSGAPSRSWRVCRTVAGASRRRSPDDTHPRARAPQRPRHRRRAGEDHPPRRRADRSATVRDHGLLHPRRARRRVRHRSTARARCGVDYVEIVERHSFDPSIWPAAPALVRDAADRHRPRARLQDQPPGVAARRRSRASIPLSTVHGWTGHSWRERCCTTRLDKRMLARFPRDRGVGARSARSCFGTARGPSRVTDGPERHRSRARSGAIRRARGWRVPRSASTPPTS